MLDIQCPMNDVARMTEPEAETSHGSSRGWSLRRPGAWLVARSSATPSRKAAALLLLTLGLLPLGLLAHDNPEQVIEWLTARIDAAGKRPDLLWRRATEYRALSRLDDAVSDLKQAIKIEPGFLPALTDLSRVQLAQGKRRQALQTINRALALVREESERAPLRMIRAEIFTAFGQLNQALAECDSALQHSSGTELDWYLTRSQIQCRLGKFKEAVAGLQQGFEQTGSAVLEVESIDAMIEAGLFTEALQKIEPLLVDCRWRSSWLIRRARVELGLGDVGRADDDLLEAIRELNQRVSGPHPDSGLLAERGLAFALLGDASLAKRDLSAAKKIGADAWVLRRLELALGGS